MFFIFKIFPKFIAFRSSDDYIKKITSKSIRRYLILFKKRSKVKKKEIFPSEKIKNSGNHIND